MAMDPERFFSAADREAVRAAVEAAESQTGGEIVPYVVGRCDGYEEVAWKGATFGALLFILGAVVLHAGLGLWGGSLLLWALLPVAAGAAGGFAITAANDTLRRWLVAAEVVERRVREAAETAFLQEEVFLTRDRTGILLFVTLFERRVMVLADAGIHARVEEGEWKAIVDRAAAEIRRGRPVEALVEAVRACGRLLAERGVARRPDDIDELPDGLRLGGEDDG